jgi:hypothetical protein
MRHQRWLKASYATSFNVQGTLNYIAKFVSKTLGSKQIK